jgi:hypothetical protein
MSDQRGASGISSAIRHGITNRPWPYLPNRWIDDPVRCEQAGVPLDARTLTSKSDHALDIVRRARARGMRFEWVDSVKISCPSVKYPIGHDAQRDAVIPSRNDCKKHPPKKPSPKKNGLLQPYKENPLTIHFSGSGIFETVCQFWSARLIFAASFLRHSVVQNLV